MGYGTVWRAGNPDEARLWWENRFPRRRLEVYLKFVTELELQCLRAAIHQAPRTVAEIIREVKVQNHLFPADGTPECEAWYQNMQGSPNPIDLVLPEFVAELRAVAGEVEAVAARWHALWDAGSPLALEHAVCCLRELTDFAVATGRKKMGVLSRMTGLSAGG